jgi:hypothetical protein
VGGALRPLTGPVYDAPRAGVGNMAVANSDCSRSSQPPSQADRQQETGWGRSWRKDGFKVFVGWWCRDDGRAGMGEDSGWGKMGKWWNGRPPFGPGRPVRCVTVAEGGESMFEGRVVVMGWGLYSGGCFGFASEAVRMLLMLLCR